MNGKQASGVPGFSYVELVIGIVLVFFGPVTPGFLLLWMLFAGEFYKIVENKELIQAQVEGARFLKKKVWSSLVACNLLFIPHYLIFIGLYSFPATLILLLSIAVFNLCFLYALTLKYSRMNFRRSELNLSIPLIIYFFAWCIPLLALWLNVSEYGRAKRQLQTCID